MCSKMLHKLEVIMIKVLIVEDQTMLRESLEHLLNAQSDIEVVGGTDDAAEAPELCKELKPDIVLLDVVTKKNSDGIHASGIHYAAEILKKFPNIKIVIMTGLPEITFIEEAKKAGAHSFINKTMGNEHLLHVIRNTMKGYSIYSTSTEDKPFTANFTEDEIAVIRLVCKGMEREEIIESLALSEAKIKKIIRSILDKTGFDSMAKFAIYAVSQGFVAPEIH